MRCGGALNPILKLTVALGQLLADDVAAASCAAIYDIRRESDSLAGSEFMVCHQRPSSFGRSFAPLPDSMMRRGPA
jgi:hypothetical protein